MKDVTEIEHHIPTSLINDNMTAAPTSPASNIPQCHEPEVAPAAGNPKSKGKGRGPKPMYSTNSKTAQNLFTINYLKDRTATCKEFVAAWDKLDNATCKMHKQHEVDSKKAAKAA
ncbi:hypothetical protein EI94DRAFT_1800905 [Lactarius quietus]|nr:hypothetical protein EI94DRAFT_1800905 [Lactarius quietus]